ncbi:MAG TPA: hypothetical protein VIR63_01150 [Pontiella sp.]
MKINLLICALFILVGCSQEQPLTYRVPKELSYSPDGDEEAGSPPVQRSAPVPTRFEATLPEGWTEQAGSGGMRMVSYSIEGSSIDFYLISLAMGDVQSNVNRWRGQVGLSAASSEEINADVDEFEVDGNSTKYIEIYNEDSGKGIIAAIIDLSPKYWYFTAKGSTSELRSHASDIRGFLESITFPEHAH